MQTLPDGKTGAQRGQGIGGRAGEGEKQTVYVEEFGENGHFWGIVGEIVGKLEEDVENALLAVKPGVRWVCGSGESANKGVSGGPSIHKCHFEMLAGSVSMNTPSRGYF